MVISYKNKTEIQISNTNTTETTGARQTQARRCGVSSQPTDNNADLLSHGHSA